MRPFLPFATLLSAVFLLGCQEQASSPVEPEGPQFDRPGGDCGPGHCPHGGNEEDLITVGADLFFNATFGGNGRTCGTCHRLKNNFTIDIKFINDLHDSDPDDLLFIAELSLAEQALLDPPVILPAFDLNNPSALAFEDPVLMLARGLILENIQGFDVDAG